MRKKRARTGHGGSAVMRVVRAKRGGKLLKMASPGRDDFPAGAVLGVAQVFGKRTCKPNSVVCGHSSRRRVAADAHQRPTRRFRHCMEQPLKRRATQGAACRIGPMRSASLAPGQALPSLFGLAPCGVYPAPAVTGRAVRSYRTFSPLPLHRASKLIQGRPSPESKGLAMAVSSLWHWPSTRLEARIPDVIRHTALRSSDFPPPAKPACARPPAATARSSCQLLV